MADLFSTALAEQARQRAKQADVLAEHARQQTVVDGLLAEVGTMEHATPEERQALMAKIVASRTSSGGAVEEEDAEDGDMPRGGERRGAGGWGEQGRGGAVHGGGGKGGDGSSPSISPTPSHIHGNDGVEDGAA